MRQSVKILDLLDTMTTIMTIEHLLCNPEFTNLFCDKEKLVAMQELLCNHTELAHMVKSRANIDRFIG